MSVREHLESSKSFVIQGKGSDSKERRCGRRRTAGVTTEAGYARRIALFHVRGPCFLFVRHGAISVIGPNLKLDPRDRLIGFHLGITHDALVLVTNGGDILRNRPHRTGSLSAVRIPSGPPASL